MPKIVNKEEKRGEIALACFELIYEVGMKNITVAQVAKTAGIGKGTVYEYFENKEDVLFEIINIHIEQYHNNFLETIKNVKSTREKIYYFFDFAMNDSEENMKNFNGYKEYLSIVLSDEHPNMKSFNTKCHSFFKDQLEQMIEQGIANNELKPLARSFVEGMMVFEKGIVLMKMSQDNFDAKKECEIFLGNLFDILEVQK